jgi:hypothetical protein
MIGIQIDQELIDKMMNQAIIECADELFLGDTRRLRHSLLQGHCTDCRRVTASLGRQISEYLGRTEPAVKAVYYYEPFEMPGGSTNAYEPNAVIHLVAWVERKSASLSALIESLGTVLKANQPNLGCADASLRCFSLDVTMVSDQEVHAQSGLGLLVEQAYLRSTPVWRRPSQGELQAPTITVESEQVKNILPETFDPELIPVTRLLEHAQAIENIPQEERGELEHHLTELKVVMIRRLISDQLAYINIAQKWFKVQDLTEIKRRKIGLGRIGGKAAGMLLAGNILKEVGDAGLRASFYVPESFFLGSDVMYIFMAMNGLMYWNDQKYKPEKLIWEQYPQIKQDYEAGSFPPEILIELRELLASVGDKPLIVRSSSLLEDNFGTAFAGKYDSHFCPNQGTPEENLEALTLAIARTYASTLKPEALLYRRSKGLQDYDERMAILIQTVQGTKYGRYYLPHGAGVAFSRNMYRWSPQIRREDGFARLVWGLGTRAVERVGNDYPRPVALGHPTLQPDDSPEAIRHYSQQYVDLIDLQENAVRTLPVLDVLRPDYPILRYIAQLERDNYLTTPRSRVMADEVRSLVITFDELLRRTPFAATLSQMLRLLEEHYHSAVDMEFTVQISDPFKQPPAAQISLLQCRPQSLMKESQAGQLPSTVNDEDIIFSTRFMAPRGQAANIRHVLFVPPETYFALETDQARKKLGGVISRLNAMLPDKSFICVGPGRWGSMNTDLGVYVCYADIYNTAALVEVTGKGIGVAPEPSLGTHFFQDLMEAQIYPLAVRVDDPNAVFNRAFFYDTPNRTAEWVECEAGYAEAIRLIEVADYRAGRHLVLAMDDEAGLAAAYLAADEEVIS